MKSAHQRYSDPDESHGGEEWSLDKSLYDASSDFVRTVLDPDDEEQLQESLYDLSNRHKADSQEADLDPFNMTDSAEEDEHAPQAPGGFPGADGAFGGPDGQQGGSARMIEGLVEALLARLQISVGKVVVHLHHDIPDDDGSRDSSIDLDLRIDGIRYALSQGQGSASPRKTLTVDDVGVWMSSGNAMHEPDEDTSPLADNKKDFTAADMMMSLGVTDLRQSRVRIAHLHDMPGRPPYDSDSDDEEEQNRQNDNAESLYQSAIGETASSGTNSPRNGLPWDLSPETGIKIFGLRSKGVVFQMWKEMNDIEGDTTSNARISADLGHLAVILDTGQIEALIKVIAAISPPGSEESSTSEDRAGGDKQASTSQLQVVSSRFDLHYLYAGTPADSSMSLEFWQSSEIIGRDHLHLSLLGLGIDKQGDEKSVLTLSACSFINVYGALSKEGGDLRRQPLLLLGPTIDHLWLPSLNDAVPAMEADKSNSETQVRVILTNSSK